MQLMLKQEKPIAGVPVDAVKISLIVMGRTRTQGSNQRLLPRKKLKKLIYAGAKKPLMHHFVMVLIANKFPGYVNLE